MGNKQYAAQQLAERFVDQREIQNVMGKYMFTTMICAWLERRLVCGA